jgi:AsmA protein
MSEPRPKRWPKILLAVVVAVVVLAAVGLQILDSFLLKTARAQAAPVAKQLGREVEIGGLSTTLLSGLGVRITGVKIGPGAGETEPLVEIGRIEVKAALLRALTSGGKDVEVRTAEVEGLHVSVVKYPDGKTNLEHLQERLAEQPKKETEPAPEPKPAADLSFLRVDHVGLTEGRMDFTDKSGAAAKALAISHLSVTVDDLRAGKPLQLVIAAAVLAEAKNFELEVVTESLPNTLQPVVKQVALKILPIDLAPLGPFVPASVGLQAGRLDADFKADLGAAVPGGDGPTSFKGALHALGLRFAGAQEGAPLDVTAETDVTADLEKGDADLKLLKLVAGPASITGTGKASGVNGAAPKLEGLEVLSHGFDPERLAGYYPPLKKQLNGMIAGPIGLSLRGSGTAEAQSLLLSIDLTPVKLEMPLVLAKAAGGKMTFDLTVRAAGAGKQAFEAKADLAGLDLKPGGSVAKGPGDVLKLAMAGERTTAGSKAAPTQHLAVPKMSLDLLADSMSGKATADLTGGQQPATKFTLTLDSARLDLDKMLLPAPKEKKVKKPLEPKAFAGLSGTMELKVASMILSKQAMTNVVLAMKLVEDEVELTAADLRAFGGSVSAAGTKLKLAHPKEPFTAKLKLAGLDLEQLGKLGSEKKVLTGKLDADVDLKGGGQEKEALAKTLAGTVGGKILDGVFYGKDLISSASGPLAKALPFGLAGKDGSGGQTSLGKELPFALLIKDGQATMTKPLAVDQPQGKLTITGGTIGLVDGTLNLPGSVALAPATIASLTGGKAKVAAPVVIGLRLTGPATSPSVSDLQLGDAVATIGKAAAAGLLSGSAGQAVTGAVGKAFGSGAGGAVGNALGGLFGGKGAGSGSGSGAAAPAAPAAEDAKKKLEDEAKNKLKGLFGG